MRRERWEADLREGYAVHEGQEWEIDISSSRGHIWTHQIRHWASERPYLATDLQLCSKKRYTFIYLAFCGNTFRSLQYKINFEIR